VLSDPIVALATPAGRSALAVVRLSGDGAFDVARRVIAGFRTDPPRTATLATFQTAAGAAIDRGLYTVFPAPASYTGDDLVELSCHGGLAVPAALVAALHAAGARPAAPGEFTRRAVLNGKMDLVQAEAIGDLIDASAPAQARAALAQLEGGLSRRLGHLRESLLELQAVLGYEIDFPGEDDGPVPIERIAASAADVGERIAQLIATAPAGERLREGAVVVLAGRPNAGKSSLFNALLGTARALVTETPGTTRDAIEAHTDVLGWPIRLVDTAGLWDSENAIDRLGIEVSRRYLGAADLALLCVEGARPLGPDEEAVLTDRRALVVRTKSDLPGGAGPDGVSAATGAGLDALRQRLAGELFSTGAVLADLEPGLTRERHRVALTRAREALAGARPHLARGGDAVLAAHHVREAAAALEELLGGMDVEEVLGRVFASFCVGK
jgi:tRNA modification GTPase